MLAAVADRLRGPGLDDRAREAGRRAQGRACEALRPGAVGRAHNEVVAVDKADDRGVRVQQARRLSRDLLEHDRGIEARPEERPEPREPLRERARAALALEELAPLERALRGVADVPGEKHVLVGERALAVEEDDARVRLLPDPGHRRTDERAVALRSEQLAQLRVEAVVARELGRREDPPLPRLDRERPRRRADAGGETLPDRVRQLVRAREDDRVARSLENHGSGGAERLRGGLRQGVERLGERERRAEDLGDPVEAALHLRLALPLLEALGVVERERREAREGLDDLDVARLETPGLPVANAENAPHLAEPHDRRAHDVLEDGVRRARRRLLRRREVVGEHGAAGLECAPDRPLRWDLPPDIPLRDADHRAASQQLAVGLQDPAVRRIGADERHDLLHQPVDDRLEVQVARQHLGRLDQRLLLPEALLVLAEQPGGMDGEAELAGDGLGERDLACLPGPDLAPVQAEHPDHAVEDEDRRGDGGKRTQGEEGVRASERGILAELAVRLDVRDGHGAAVARGKVHGRQVRSLVAHRLDSRRVPFCEHGHRLPALAEPDEATRDAADRLRGLLDGDLEDGVEVELGADATADLRDQPLALECGLQGFARPCPAEGEGRFAGHAPDGVELGLREAPVGVLGHDDEHAGHLALGDDGNERGALRGHGLGEPPIDVRRRRDVVDRDRLAGASRLDEGTRVLVEVQRDGAPPVGVDAAGGEADRAARVLVDPGEQQGVGFEQGLHLVEERLDRLVRRLRPRERCGEAGDGVGLAAALGGQLLRLAHATAGGEEKAAVVAPEEHDQARDRDGDRAADHEPGRLSLEDVSVGERQAAEQPGECGYEREEQPDSDPEPRRPPLPHQRDAEQDRNEPVQHRKGQERHGVEHRLRFVAHGVWP